MPSSFCRICLSDDAPLITPCKCRGTIAHVHNDCLLEWVQVSGSTRCELCHGEFVMRSGGMKRIDQWRLPRVQQNSPCSRVNKWLLFFYPLFFILLIFLIMQKGESIVQLVQQYPLLFVIIIVCGFLYAFRYLRQTMTQFFRENRYYTFRNQGAQDSLVHLV
ncbi:unnamed protein product, partial [Mesorhabditis belari]|uniref:RING-CH-type domain-containing protein n=1 Tax=Mesorhabditis belari TaxID=2138241 RepID=A0AAF3FEZ8_9BILA